MINIKNIPTILVGKMPEYMGHLLDILYPPECPVCQKILFEEKEIRLGIHRECSSKLKWITDPMCKKCGKPLLSEQQEYCYDCIRRFGSFESGHGLWLYDDCSSASVFAYKYGGKRVYADFYAGALLSRYGDWIQSLKAQQLVPVPVSRQKRRQRGFNQAELLAKRLGKILDLPVNAGGLQRIHSTAPQKELGREARRKNLETAFSAGEDAFGGVQRVLLIDDIYTTGSTIEYCTRALKKAGVEKVWFLTLCIGGVF